MNLLRTARSRDEQLNAQDVATLVHGQDGRHPRADPFEVFGGADDPDEEDAAGGEGAGGVAGHEVAHVGDLVGDSYAAGEEDDGAVRMQRMQAAIWAFDKRTQRDAAIRGALGFFKQGVGEAGAPADDEGHGGFLAGEHVLAGHGEALFRVEVFGGVAPGDGEGVRGPEAEGGDGDVHVLAGAEGPGTGHFHGDADGVAGEGFDDGFGAAFAEVSVDERTEADESLGVVSMWCQWEENSSSYLGGPEDNDGLEIALCREPIQMNPNTGNGQDDQGNMQMQESLVECMTQNGACL